MNNTSLTPSPATATSSRLARIERLRSWLDTNGTLRHSRTLEKIASGNYGFPSSAYKLEKFLETESTLHLMRDFYALIHSSNRPLNLED